MGLIHVPAGEDARFFPEGTNQSGIAFEIHHLCLTFASQARILSGDVHNDRKLRLVPIVPEYQKAGMLGKEMLTGGAVSIGQTGRQFRAHHRVTLPI